MGDQPSLYIWHSDIGISIHFQESGIVMFLSIELGPPLEVSRDVRPPVQMRWVPRAFSKDCTEASDIPLSCEMKDEPAFKPLQEIRPSFESGNLGIHST